MVTSNQRKTMKNRTQNTKTLLATVALAGLMSGSVVRLHAATTDGSTQVSKTTAAGQLADDTDKGKHDCKGMNSCKGQGGCKTGDNGCKGLNSCKGKGGCSTNKKATT
jgi:hypothetical protein